MSYNTAQSSYFTYPFHLKVASLVVLIAASLALIATLCVLMTIERPVASNLLLGAALWLTLGAMTVVVARRVYYLHTTLRISQNAIRLVSPFGFITRIAWADIAMLDYQVGQGRLNVWSATTHHTIPILMCLTAFDDLHDHIDQQILAARHERMRDFV